MIDIETMLSFLVPLVLFVMAFVELLKKVGVAGKWLTLGAFIFGVILGALVRIAVAPPVVFFDWVIAVLYGLLLGFIATGTYDTGKEIHNN